MSSLEHFSEVFAQLRRAWAENRLAHAYLISGSPSGAGLALAQSILKLLFCESADKPCGTCASCHRVDRRQQPDIVWLEPEKKSRIITVESVRELSAALGQTAFGGGWKAGVLLGCDRLKEEGANAFLKTLEEPPGRTLLLLVTDQAQAMLPTLLSRCQRLVLDEEVPHPAWREPLIEILSRHTGDHGVDAMLLAGRLKALLEQVKESIKDPDAGTEETDQGEPADETVGHTVQEARRQALLARERAELLRCVQYWQRDLLACRVGADPGTLHFKDQAATLQALSRILPLPRLLERIEAVDRVVRLTEVNVSELVALEASLLPGRPPRPRR